MADERTPRERWKEWEESAHYEREGRPKNHKGAIESSEKAHKASEHANTVKKEKPHVEAMQAHAAAAEHLSAIAEDDDGAYETSPLHDLIGHHKEMAQAHRGAEIDAMKGHTDPVAKPKAKLEAWAKGEVKGMRKPKVEWIGGKKYNVYAEPAKHYYAKSDDPDKPPRYLWTKKAWKA